MVIDDFYIFRALFRPAKTNSILIVHANAMLTSATALQEFQPISRRDAKLIQLLDKIQLLQFSKRHAR